MNSSTRFVHTLPFQLPKALIIPSVSLFFEICTGVENSKGQSNQLRRSVPRMILPSDLMKNTQPPEISPFLAHIRVILQFESMEIRSVIQCASNIDTHCFRTYLICGNELKFTKTVVTWYGSLRSACESTENSGGIKSSRNRMESTQNHFYRCNEWFSATGALRMLCRGLSQKLRKAMDGSESRFLRNQVDLRTSI